MKRIIRTFTVLVLVAVMLCGAVLPLSAGTAEYSFKDVKENAWYYNAVTYVCQNGLMVGTAENTFSPNVKFTRAMTVQVLSQLSGDDLSGYKSADFPDVPDKAWFATAVAWAQDKEIVAGIDGKFKPNDNVTREQLARMIHQFSVKYGIVNNFAGGLENTDSFADAKKIGAWAKEDIDWAVHNCIISGVGENKLDPKGTATRAQAAQMFYYLHFMKVNGTVPPDTADFDKLTVSESTNLRVICWGDSMTQGGYPEELQAFARKNGYSDFRALNYGAGGDTAEHVAMKQGGMPMYVAPFTIPASKDSVKVELYDENYQYVESLADLGNKGLYPATIAGVTGNLYFNWDDECYYFARLDKAPFEEVRVTRLTRVVTKGMSDQRTNDFHVIFSGPSNNYEYTDAHKLIATQERMLDYIGNDNYIIISLTSLYYLPQLWEFNEDLAEHYGEHFLDFRTYAIEHGLEDAAAQGLIDLDARDDYTKQMDEENIAKGEIPYSMLSDYEHGNYIYNTLLGQQVFYKLQELGFLN